MMTCGGIDHHRLARLCKTLFAIAGLVFAGISACENTEEPGLPPVPTINSVSPSTASPGDTVLINGADFSSSFESNTVTFNNPVRTAKPFAGSTTQLHVVVSRDAVSGPVTVSVPDQPQAGVGGSLTVPARAIGEPFVYGGIGTGIDVPYPSASAEYLLIPHATSPSVSFVSSFSYNITAEASNVAPLPMAVRGVKRPSPVPGVREQFELHLRHEEHRLGDATRTGTVGKAGRRPGLTSAPPEQQRMFNVLMARGLDVRKAASYKVITALLVAKGSNCLIYADVDTLPTGNFSKADYDYFAATFDSPIYLTNTTNFGSEHDVDGNSKVIVVISPVVNRITDRNESSFVAGFFNSVDLLQPGGEIESGATNQAEVVYVLAADPIGVFSGAHTVAFLLEENVSTLAHEFEHLISFSIRIFEQGGRTQVVWLEEGMAHTAEDLNGFNDSNRRRAARYLDGPSLISLEDNTAPVTQRGGIYLMLRWLGDQFGEEIYKSIVSSRCSGRACIESVTDEDFYLTVADFFAMLYLTGRGISQNPTYEFDLLNSIYDDTGLSVTLPVANASAGGSSVSGAVRRSSAGFVLFTNTMTPQTTFTIDAGSSPRMRTVIVRTK